MRSTKQRVLGEIFDRGRRIKEVAESLEIPARLIHRWMLSHAKRAAMIARVPQKIDLDRHAQAATRGQESSR